MESSSVTVFQGTNENHSEDTRSDSLCENRVKTEVRVVHDWTDTWGIRFGKGKKI